MDSIFNLITDFKKGDKVKIIETKIKEIFGRNHGMNCDDILEFIEIYSDNRGTGHFKTSNGDIYTLKANCVKKIDKNKRKYE